MKGWICVESGSTGNFGSIQHPTDRQLSWILVEHPRRDYMDSDAAKCRQMAQY